MKRILPVVLAALCLAGMWLHVDRVLIAHQVSYAVQHGTPRGNLSDLYPRWLGARELLLHGRDPYSREVTEQIQKGYYGRVLDPARPHDPSDQQGFAYPLYTVFLLAPTVKLPFPLVRMIFFWLLLTLTICSVILWLRFLQWRVGWTLTTVLALLTIGSFAAVQGLKLQQLTLLVGFLFAASLALLSAEQFVAAGILLALATIKPHLALPLAAWLILWALSKWQERWTFLVSFLVSLVALVGGAEILLPGWISRFHAALLAYEGYATSGPLFEQALPRSTSTALVIALIAALATACWRARKSGIHQGLFLHVTSLVLAVTLLVLPTYPPYNQLLLLPAVFLLVRHGRELWARGFPFRVLLSAIAVPLVWSWAAAIIVATASFFTPAAQNFWEVPLWTSFVLPIPVVACVGLLIWKQLLLKQEPAP